MTRDFRILLILAGCAVVAACSGNSDDPILRLAAAEALEQGKAELEAKKYYKARRLLTHAFEVEPNSRTGREALLLAADAFYLHGGPDNFVKCEAKYRDFLNRFPTSDRADYAQYQVANCLRSRMEKADRDQKVSHQALEAYHELIRLYPTSEYTEDARDQIIVVRNNLARSEFLVGKFYFRYGLCTAAIQRFEVLDEEYPQFGEMDEALFWLGLAYRQCDQDDNADSTLTRLRTEYPDSAWLAEVDKRDEKVRKKREKWREKQQRRLNSSTRVKSS